MPDEEVSTSETIIAVLRKSDGSKTVIREKREESLEDKLERLKKCRKQLISVLQEIS